jgi:hypothetical protein
MSRIFGITNIAAAFALRQPHSRKPYRPAPKG